MPPTLLYGTDAQVSSIGAAESDIRPEEAFFHASPRVGARTPDDRLTWRLQRLEAISLARSRCGGPENALQLAIVAPRIFRQSGRARPQGSRSRDGCQPLRRTRHFADRRKCLRPCCMTDAQGSSIGAAESDIRPEEVFFHAEGGPWPAGLKPCATRVRSERDGFRPSAASRRANERAGKEALVRSGLEQRDSDLAGPSARSGGTAAPTPSPRTTARTRGDRPAASDTNRGTPPTPE